MNDPKEQNGGFSRRAFLRGSGAVAAASTVGPAAGSAQAAPEDGALGPGPVAVTLNVNGKEHRLQIEPRITLLDALRDYLDTTGPKRVCDRGTSGADTVLVDGKPVYASIMLAIEAQGKKIVTAEGLVQDGRLNAVQEAFCRHDASQCGFCTPGFVVAATAALRKDPRASIEEIKRGLDGNICRCGTYEQMAQAIAELAGGRKS